MNHAGDAAEQIVRLSLEGAEIALRLTGSASKNIAAAIYAAMQNKDKTKTKGKQRLGAMLKSGKELKVFTVSETKLKQFVTQAKRYGVVYCALRGKSPAEDGMVDILVRAEDAAKINRIVERFQLATVATATPENPAVARTEQPSLSGPISKQPKEAATGIIRPSVRKTLKDIQTRRAASPVPEKIPHLPKKQKKER